MPKTDSALKEGEDFYYNKDGLMVLTAKYHLRRGYCCKSDCTHCPFESSKNIDPDVPQEFQTSWSDESDSDEEIYIDPNWEID